MTPDGIDFCFLLFLSESGSGTINIQGQTFIADRWFCCFL